MQNDQQERSQKKDAVAHDALLECLMTLGKIHGLALQREALLAGLPLDKGRIRPALFSRAAQRAGFTSRIVRRGIEQLNPALFPVILQLDKDDACLVHECDLENNTASVTYSELADAPVTVALQELEARYTGIAFYVRPLFRYDIRTPEVRKLKRRHWFWSVIEENKQLYRDILVAALMINLMALAMPLFIRNVYDRVLPNLAIDTLWGTASAVLLVLPKDIAFVFSGQKALVKLTAYEFSIYGGLEADVYNISPDTVTDEQGNTFYLVRVKTHKSSIGKGFPIIPGMMAQVDILTGKRTVLMYLLKPILRGTSNAMKER